MTLNQGDPAPDFTLFTDGRQPWSLADQRGKPVLLLFFPGAFSSTCTTELNAVNNDLHRYTDASAVVVGISTDSHFVLAEYRKVNALGFPLLSDHDGEVSERYGAKYDRDFSAMKLSRISKRSVFLIDEQGMIRYAEVLQNADDQPNFDALHAAMEAA